MNNFQSISKFVMVNYIYLLCTLTILQNKTLVWSNNSEPPWMYIYLLGAPLQLKDVKHDADIKKEKRLDNSKIPFLGSSSAYHRRTSWAHPPPWHIPSIPTKSSPISFKFDWARQLNNPFSRQFPQTIILWVFFLNSLFLVSLDVQNIEVRKKD